MSLNAAGCCLNILGRCFALAALVAILTPPIAVLAEDAAHPFRFQEINASSLGLWEGAQPVLVYNHGLIRPPEGASGKPRASYIHPLYGLDGEVLTDDFPKDHTYHRGIYSAWPHLKIGNREQEFDQWSLRSLASEFQKWTAREISAHSATLGIENGWFLEGKQVVRELVTLRVHPAGKSSRAIDVELTWTPLEEPITVWGAPEKSYGGFNFRFARPKRPTITVPSGRTADDLVVTRLPWADYSNEFLANPPKGQVAMSGAAVFVHPRHPDHPPEWMTRHYGLISAGWPGVNAQTLPAKQPTTLRYRLWIHRGNPEAAEIQKAYESYCAESNEGVAWNIDNLEAIGGHAATKTGSPRAIETPQGQAIEFDGKDDGLFLETNPLAGLAQFTAEIIFRPAAGGPEAQRFFHMQEDGSDNRLLFETRLTGDGRWFLDTFLKSGESSATLFAKESLHAIGPWYHAAVTFDGQTMRHFVNGAEELKAEVNFRPLKEGRTSLGVRLNRVSWYQGAIRQVRISPRVLRVEEFLKP
jgi:hypothetical protein